MNRLISEFSLLIRQFDAIIPALFNRHPFPPENFAILINSEYQQQQQPVKQPFSIKDIIGDGFLFAVPIFRRSLEVRKIRKIGIAHKGREEHLKILRKKNNILTCTTCGHYYEIGVLCPHCYKKVMDETKAIQEKILDKLKLNPIEHDVVVLYEGEKEKKDEEFWNGRRIVELEKPRPSFFSKNLLQKTTQGNAETSEIGHVDTVNLKPENLG